MFLLPSFLSKMLLLSHQICSKSNPVSSSYLNNYSESLIKGKSCQVSIFGVRETGSQSSILYLGVTSLAPVTRDTRDAWQGQMVTLTIDKDPLWNTSPRFLPSAAHYSNNPNNLSLPPWPPLPNWGYGCRETLHNLFLPHPPVCRHHIVLLPPPTKIPTSLLTNYPKLECDFDWIQH